MSDIEQFWRKIHDASGVRNCKLFEGVSPSSCNLARRVMNPKIAWGARKIRLFTRSSKIKYAKISSNIISFHKLSKNGRYVNKLTGGPHWVLTEKKNKHPRLLFDFYPQTFGQRHPWGRPFSRKFIGIKPARWTLKFGGSFHHCRTGMYRKNMS